MATLAQPAKVRVSPRQVLDILLPYSWHHVREQIIIVVPVCLYLALFHFLVLRSTLGRVAGIVTGIAILVLGLAFFLEGVRVGLVPMGDTIGNTLPRRSRLPTVLVFAF
ncbi:MAG TPA: DUF1538 family protein, partial [Vicinamibacteria bacterium]